MTAPGERTGEDGTVVYRVGVCDLCGQSMVLTATDCWHPHDVDRACPPEPPSGTEEWEAWSLAGNRTGRPGREHFVEMS